MDKEYHLDMKTLLQYLGELSVILQTKLTLPGSREQYIGRVFIKKGQILACFIFKLDNTLTFIGDEAYQRLESQRQWQVHIEPNIEMALQSMMPQSERSRLTSTDALTNSLTPSIPRQKNRLTPDNLKQFKYQERVIIQMVLAKIDGKRTIDEIKQQVNLPPDYIDAVCNILRSLDIIF